MTTDTEQTTALAVSVLSQIEELNEQQVIARLTGGLPEVTKKWVYSFPQGGSTVTGLSIDGVQEAARHLSTQGEAIEQLWIHMDEQNEREAFFTGCAVRYAVSPTGQRVELDRAIRAKRQPKWTKKRDGSGEVFNEFWYEVGVAKALRNAVEALLPEAIKQHMIKAAGAAPKVSQSPPRQQQPQRMNASQPTPDAPVRPQEAILADITTARETWDKESFTAWAKAIREAFPAAFANGKPALAELDGDTLRALAERVHADVAGQPQGALDV